MKVNGFGDPIHYQSAAVNLEFFISFGTSNVMVEGQGYVKNYNQPAALSSKHLGYGRP